MSAKTFFIPGNSLKHLFFWGPVILLENNALSLILVVAFVIWEQCSVWFRVICLLLLRKDPSPYSARCLMIQGFLSLFGGHCYLSQGYFLSLASSHICTDYYTMEDPLKISGVSFLYSSSDLFCKLCFGWLDSQFHIFRPSVFTELHLGSSSLCCGLKTLSRELYLNCLMPSVLKTITIYILFVFSLDRNINLTSMTPSWPKAEIHQDVFIFSQEFLVVCLNGLF